MAGPPRFDAAWQRRRRWRAGGRGVWRSARWFVLLALLLGAVWLAQQRGWGGGTWQRIDRPFALCGQRAGTGCVIDGDTLAIGPRRIRLTGYDAPELDGACLAERQLAQEARAQLLDWLNRGPFELDAGDGPPHDQFGRALRAARRDSAMLADDMVERGLARRSRLDAGWC